MIDDIIIEKEKNGYKENRKYRGEISKKKLVHIRRIDVRIMTSKLVRNILL